MASTGQIPRDVLRADPPTTRNDYVPLNVLLADDDPTMRVLLSHVIVQAGHTVTAVAADGEAAWHAFVAAPAPVLSSSAASSAALATSPAWPQQPASQAARQLA